MRRPARARGTPGFLATVLCFGLASLPAAPRPLEAQPARPSCESCHGELEFLRQHKETLGEARALLAPAAVLAASAHGSLTCTDCHDGFRRFPHRGALTTRTCASCHEETAAGWQRGVHALDQGASCTACHGTHDVRTVEAMREPEGIQAMRAACSGCHYEPRIPAEDPHNDSVSCASCHEPHLTLPSEDPEASTHVANQVYTCGACHEEAAAAWDRDIHAEAVRSGAASDHREGSHGGAPACSGCHGAHGILAPSAPGFGIQMVEQCSQCHEHYRESFADSYHGQAAILGSERVATCHSCHGAHGVHPTADPRSTVHPDNLLGTCQSCHPAATAGFALFQPHADHYDRERYPYVYWSYHLMTALLIGTFTVFGAHTLLWLARLGLDALRGTPHSSHHGHGGER